MLRSLFNEPRRVDSGVLLETNRSIEQFCRQLKKLYSDRKPEEVDPKVYVKEMQASGFIVALDELEQSVYCSGKFAQQIRKPYVDDMSEEELQDYRLHLYFYKNAFIRIFSVLDKLGYFMNDLFEVKTERKKPRFSYFTVLRQMHEERIHPELEQKLYDLKESCKEPLKRLRLKRNQEIHSMNMEMLDDLLQPIHSFFQKTKVENIQQNMTDLRQAFDMVCQCLKLVFVCSTRWIKK